ncbi:MAG TPA: hypothetical protein VE665_02445 [Hyphomicrobiaceae bacterium]|jgi:HK97 gp10 family phage protein|nr:hypothetical protein [Hyphomicrobiaceae bacterium]
MPDNGRVTVTGLDEYRRAVAALPAEVTAKLHTVAEATAVRIQAAAKNRLRAQLQTGRHALIDAITVNNDPAHRQVQVLSAPPPGQAAMLPMFVEYGTVKMPARPYMRPAADAAGDAYTRAIELASDAVVRKALA